MNKKVTFAIETEDGPVSYTYEGIIQDFETPVFKHNYRPEPQVLRLFRNEMLILDSGRILHDIKVAFHTYGTLNTTKDNAILVLHALTGTSAVHEWWSQMFGVGSVLDPEKSFIVCSNVLGGCAGSSGADDFGLIDLTLGDMVRVQQALCERLGIAKMDVLGGSMGGMQVLEWMRSYPEYIKKAVVIAAPRRHSVWAKAFNVAQRAAITSDPEFKNGRYTHQPKGLDIARQIAMISYRSPESFQQTQNGKSRFSPQEDAIYSYLHYHGDKLRKRFDANTYLMITRAMDEFDVSDYELRHCTIPTLAVGISSDTLYFAHEVKEWASLMPNAEYWQLNSPHGHDAFLIEFEVLNRKVQAFLQNL